MKQRQVTLSCIFICTLLAQNVVGQELKKYLTAADKLTYNGYKVMKYYNESKSLATVVITRKGQLLARHKESYFDKTDTRFGLVSILNDQTKQLIVEQYSGGAHCCYSRFIYALSPKFRLLFSSNDYWLSDGWGEAKLIDLDRDGIPELFQSCNWYAYFERLNFAESPLPLVIFKYDRGAKAYYPANPQFSKYLLKNIRRDEIYARNFREKPYSLTTADNLGPVLHVLLTYIYAGKETQAWRFFDQAYQPADKRQMKYKIKQRLRKDSIVRVLKRLYKFA